MRIIPLTQDKVALVDDEDYEHLIRFKWHAVEKKNCFYAARKDRQGRTIYMHTVIMETPSGLEVDHRNGEGLDNQRSNLRIGTHQQNLHNTRPGTKNTSGFKGVSWCAYTGRWRVQIRIDNRYRHLGRFDDPILAARAYDEAALELCGEFACTNTSLGLIGENDGGS